MCSVCIYTCAVYAYIHVQCRECIYTCAVYVYIHVRTHETMLRSLSQIVRTCQNVSEFQSYAESSNCGCVGRVSEFSGIHVCDMTDSCVGHGSYTCATCHTCHTLIQMFEWTFELTTFFFFVHCLCDMIHFCIGYHLFVRVP